MSSEESVLLPDEHVLGGTTGSEETRSDETHVVRGVTLVATSHRVLAGTVIDGWFRIETEFPYDEIKSIVMDKIAGYALTLQAENNAIALKFIQDGEGVQHFVDQVNLKLGQVQSQSGVVEPK